MERHIVYKFLSECYILPDEERIQMLRSYGEYLPNSFVYLIDIISDNHNLDQLILDFSRLFLGPLNLLAPPYGSIYLEGRKKLMGESTNNILEWFASENLELEINDIPDHIAFELEFMYVLILREMQAREEKNETEILDYLNKQNEFLKLHLGSWIKEFTKCMKDGASSSFYKELAKQTKKFIAHDMLFLDETLKEKANKVVQS